MWLSNCGERRMNKEKETVVKRLKIKSGLKKFLGGERKKTQTNYEVGYYPLPTLDITVYV